MCGGNGDVGLFGFGFGLGGGGLCQQESTSTQHAPPQNAYTNARTHPTCQATAGAKRLKREDDDLETPRDKRPRHV